MSNSGPPSNYGAVRKRSRDRFENSNQGQSYHRQDSYDYSAPPYPERRSDDYRKNWGDRSQHQQDYPYHSTQYDYRGYQDPQRIPPGAHQNYSSDYGKQPYARQEIDRSKLPRHVGNIEQQQQQQYNAMKQPMITKPSVSGTHFSKPATTFNAIGPLPPPTPPPPSFAALSHTAAKNKIVTQTESPRSVAIIECFRDIEIGYVAYRAARARAHLGLQQNYLTVAEVVSDTLATIALKSHKHTEPTNEPITTTTTTSTTSPATTNILVSLSKNTTVGVASVNPIPVARVAPRVHRAIEEREEGEEEEEDDVGIDISIPTVNTAASVQSIPGSAPGSAPGSYSIPKAYPSHPSHPSPNPNPPRAPPGQHHQHPLSRVAPPLSGKSHSHAQSGYPPRPLPPRFVPSDYNQSFKR